MAIGSAPAEVKPRPTREYDLKAAFLFNLAKFVEWPVEAFGDADTPITICILGEDPFGRSLDEIVSNESVRNRELVVRRYRDMKKVAACHILFVNLSRPADLQGLRTYLEDKPVLTVGETEEFVDHSGIIRFVMVGNKVRLRINIEAARAARLTISSKLLRLAEVVGIGSGP